ncbi:MAG: hypothetical protein CMF48_03380 [Legionellales bacterium]|nr:hypothetical protein [Legionellales bacterium]|tara:strand:+ start:1479 stop:1640 length:162 start_codon:yes stop_codon:yes gene_type:complete
MSEIIKIKLKTVGFHVGRIKKKFKVRTIVELALKVCAAHLYALLKEGKGILLI